MAELALTEPLAALDQTELKRLAVVAGKWLAGRSSTMGGGRPHRRQPGRGLEFFDHRPYVAGDEVRHVDWRQTARRDTTMVRRFVHEASTDWLVCLDCSASMQSAMRHKWTLGLQLAAAISYLLLYLGDRVALAGFSKDLDAVCRPGRGAGHYTRLLMVLRDLSRQPRGNASQPGACAPLARRGDAAIVITDGLSEDGMQADIALLAAQCAHVQVLHLEDPLDTTLPSSVSLRLVDVETDRTQSVASSPALADAAQAAYRNIAATLRGHCLARDIPYTRVNAASHWRDALLDHLRPSAGRHV